MALAAFFLAPILFNVVVGQTNDWNRPCFDGKCSYDHPDPSFPASLQISGSHRSVSDISKAGGWTILNCDPHTMEQDVRLVCHSSDCNHLFNGHGAIDTLVRLPENCGKNAFARVADIRVDPNQYIPHHISKRIPYGTGRIRTVHIASIDTNFKAAHPSRAEPVAFSVSGSHQGVPNSPPSQLARRVWPFDRTVDDTFQLATVDVDQTFPALDIQVSCPDLNATVKADLYSKLHIDASITIEAKGWIFLIPGLSSFEVTFAFDTDFAANLTISASASGKADSGQVVLYTKPFGGLNFAGLLTVGPNFKLIGQVTADLQVGFDLALNLAYNLKDRIVFPASDHTPQTPQPAKSVLSLSAANASVASVSNITVHIIPTIALEIEALGGVAGGSLFLNCDASLGMGLQLNASTGAGAVGCLDIDAGVAVNIGAEAHFGIPGILEAKTLIEDPLYSHQWTLLDKCFGKPGHARRAPTPPSSRNLLAMRDATLTCPPELKYLVPAVIFADSVASLIPK